MWYACFFTKVKVLPDAVCPDNSRQKVSSSIEAVDVTMSDSPYANITASYPFMDELDRLAKVNFGEYLIAVLRCSPYKITRGHIVNVLIT